MNSIVKAQNLIKKYGELNAVDGVDFEILEGETFGFLGPNGAGKTTIMKMIYCFVRPTAGQLSVLGHDVLSHARQIKSILGVVPQDDSLDPDLTVLGNLIVYSRYYEIPEKIARQRAESLLDMMSLTDKRNVVIEQLSGGMKRRLLIARGLINNPRILILDEPTTGLDPQARLLVWTKLKELRSSGITILITTHYMEEAFRLCGRLLMMNNGKILDSGNPAELIKKHIGHEVVEISDIDDDIYEKVKAAVDGTTPIEKFGDRAYIFSESAGDIAPKLRHLDLPFISERRANLEDVFLKLTGRTLID